jgi:hypothetical protein
MNTALISTIISVAAFAVAAYGILERRKAASRAERIGLTTIIDELAQTRYQLTDVASKGTTKCDLIEALNTRIELLSQQAKSLIQEHALTITSTECREVAYCLKLAGYVEDSDDVWQVARDTARPEGRTQEFFANSGYAYFLFDTERADEAREILQVALSHHPTNTDSERISHASTPNAWVGWEIRTQGPEAPIVAELSQQIDELISACSTPAGKQMVSLFAFKAIKGVDINPGAGRQPKGA